MQPDLKELSKEGNIIVSVSMADEAMAPFACQDFSPEGSHAFIHVNLEEDVRSSGVYEGTLECDGIVEKLHKYQPERAILGMVRTKRIVGEQLEQHLMASFATARNWTLGTGRFQRLCQILRPDPDKLRLIAASASINPFSRSSVMLKQNGGFVYDYLNKHSGQGFHRVEGVYDTTDPEFPGGSIVSKRF